jgi:hypothetical protein
MGSIVLLIGQCFSIGSTVINFPLWQAMQQPYIYVCVCLLRVLLSTQIPKGLIYTRNAMQVCLRHAWFNYY